MTVRQDERLVQSERLVRVEERVDELREKVDGLDKKMDSLLELKYKGMGAFWLATAIIGVGISVLFTNVLHYIGLR